MNCPVRRNTREKGMRRMGDAPGAGDPRGGEALDACLDGRERAAAMEVVRQVRRRVGARLEHALLFGSKARRQARPDSDVDVLLVFRRLPPDREPQASDAERIADKVARRTGVPVGVWSVSLEDLEQGRRTPMLVDALDDAVPLWPGADPPRVPFTPLDAAFCAARLLERVDEGGEKVARSLARGDDEWRRRGRDDLVRLCTAVLLLAGDTRPRRGDAIRAFLARNPRFPLSAAERAVLAWAARSYPRGHLEMDDDHPVPHPPTDPAVLLDLIERLRELVASRGAFAEKAVCFVHR
ncbi:nucleotidyltransferase domain-containing protein [Longimicrobium sp.]|uniref:nucleotidyltransferase domain-containing protein n=1 Tax=Longimicrobium sp. TaxID=2029185 RepID=UPI003B3BB3CA